MNAAGSGHLDIVNALLLGGADVYLCDEVRNGLRLQSMLVTDKIY